MLQKNLRIVILDLDDIKNPLLNGGQAKATFEVGKRLAQRGHQVTVISSRYPGSRERKESGIRYTHIGIGTRHIKLNNLLYILALPFHLPRRDADLIIECSTAPISTLFSPLFTHIPVVIVPSMFNAIHFTKKYGLPFHLVERLGARYYRYALPYTKELADRIRKINANISCKVVPHGVSEEYFSVEAKKPSYILFLSRLDIAQKGIDLLLTAYASVKDRINIPLVIAGHGPDKEKVEQLITSLNLKEHVRLAGPAYGETKKRLMESALFTALTNKGGGMSIWALESLAAGLPVVCFDIPDTRWIPESASFKVKAFEVNDYANKLREAATSPFLNKMRTAARRSMQKYSWDSVAEAYESFFFQVLKETQKMKPLNERNLAWNR